MGAFYCVVCTRRYEATGTVQVQKESADAMGLSSLMSGGEGASDALGANINLQTQANILQSDTLALRTIEDLHMEGTQDFKPHWSLLGMVLGWFSPSGPADASSTALENAPQRRLRALKVFAANLKVQPIGGTRIIKIVYRNPDPKLAAAVVNKLTQSLVDYTFQTRFNATNQASQWLSAQLGDLRQESQDLQAKVVGLQKASGVYSLGTTDTQGREQAYSGVLDHLQQVTAAASAAQQNRILKGAVARAAETGNAEMLSGLAGNAMIGQSQAVSNSLSLIQNLRQQEATQQAALQQLEAKFGADYPKVAEVRGNIAGLERSIRQESDRIKGRAESDYQVAQQTEAETKRELDQAKRDAGELNDKTIEYAMARQEAEQSRGLYEDLLKRLKEAGVLEGLRSSNITVIDPGRVPARPQKPNVPLYMAIAFGGGLFLGGLSALLVDTLDNKINTIEEVEEIVGQSVLGATPHTEQTTSRGLDSLTSLKEPQSTYTESLRSIRTGLLMTGEPTDQGSRVVLVTSSIPSEGKTTFSTNLAIILAQSNRKVLLVDMDLRRGGIRHKLGLGNRSGLSDMLANQGPAAIMTDLIPALPGFHVLLAGNTPPNPSELLEIGIKQLIAGWRKEYDFIILDAPPVLPVTDPVIVNPLADITLLLARVRLTERAQLRQTYRTLTTAAKHYTGVVLNGLRPRDESYYGYYGYRKYAYNYAEDDNAQRS
jgi:capsular exopolysaccharide synthesis family protein